MPLIYQKWIRRADLKANPTQLYVFGDNFEHRGLGGQAKEMRGEPNALGFPTKHKPTMQQSAFFHDEEFSDLIKRLTPYAEPIDLAIYEGKTVVWPTDGIGSGLSCLPIKAPKLWKYLEDWRLRLEE